MWKFKPKRVEAWDETLVHQPLFLRLELYLRAWHDGNRVSLIVPSSLLHDRNRRAPLGDPWFSFIGTCITFGWRVEYDVDTDSYRIESRHKVLGDLHTLEYCVRKTEGAVLSLLPLVTRE